MELLFSGFFSDFISQGIGSVGALLWRLITYYPYLIIGVFATFSSLFLGATPFVMANIALFSLVIAEIVRLALQLFFMQQARAA